MEDELRDKLLCERNDAIDNAVFAAVSEMAVGEIDWDMEIIGAVEAYIEKLLGDRGIPVCHPWEDDNETLCCCGEESCPYCWVKGIEGEITC